jgi:hypothetical protein
MGKMKSGVKGEVLSQLGPVARRPGTRRQHRLFLSGAYR